MEKRWSGLGHNYKLFEKYNQSYNSGEQLNKNFGPNTIFR